MKLYGKLSKASKMRLEAMKHWFQTESGFVSACDGMERLSKFCMAIFLPNFDLRQLELIVSWCHLLRSCII